MSEMRQPVQPWYLDYRGAEQLTGLSRWTLSRAVERGELKASKVGSAVRFSVSELTRFMESRAR